jgi:hypothetical protein
MIPPWSQKWTCVSVRIFQMRGYIGESIYIAATNSDICNAQNHIVSVFNFWIWAFLYFRNAWIVQKDGWILEIGCHCEIILVWLGMR